MSHRFFIDSKNTDLQSGMAPSIGQSICLQGDQAHHAINVMRFKAGDEVVLFDGSSFQHGARIDEVKKKSLVVTVFESVEISNQFSTQISIAVALPKGDRQKFLIEKMVELGVAKLIPLKTNRSVAVPNEKVIERLKKQVIEACKQCGRNTLMDISAPQTLKQLINSIGPVAVESGRVGVESGDEQTESGMTSGMTLLLADPYCDQAISDFPQSSNVMIAVGPEGGFDDEESKSLLDAGYQPVKIGNSILRIETACIAAAAILGIGKANSKSSAEHAQ